MRYSGSLTKDIKNEALLPRVVFETAGLSRQEIGYALKRLYRCYRKNPIWGKMLVKEINSQDGGRNFLKLFGQHWAMRVRMGHQPLFPKKVKA